MTRFILSFILIFILSLNICIAQDYSDPVARLYAKIRIDSLQNVANRNMAEERYSEAISISEKILNETMSIYGDSAPECGFVFSRLASLYSSIRDFANAADNAKRSLDIISKTTGTNNIDYAIVIDNLSKYYNELGDYENGYNNSLIATTLFKKLCSENSIDYAIALGNLANNAHGLGNDDEAISCGEKCLEIIEELYGKNNESYASFLDNLANYYYRKGYKERAIICNLEAHNIWKDLVSKTSWDWAICNGNLGSHYFDMEEYESALPFLIEAKHSYEKLGASELPIYETYLLELMTSYLQKDNIDNAIEICEILLKRHESENNKKAYDTEIILISLLSHKGNDSRLEELTSSFELRHKEIFKNKEDYVKGLIFLSSIYESINNIDKAKKCNIKIQKLMDKIKDRNMLLNLYCELFDKTFSSKDLHSAHNWANKIMDYEKSDYSILFQKLTIERAKNICSVSDWLERYDEAVEYGNLWINICKETNSMNNYVDALITCATYNSHLGRYPQAINMGEACLCVIDSIPNEISLIYECKSTVLNNLGKYYIQLGNYERAISLFNESLELKDSVSNGYAITLSNLASCYSDMSDYQKSIQLQEEARSIFENDEDINTLAYSTLLMNLGNDYCKVGDYSSALECLDIAYQSQCDYLGETHSSTLLTLSNIGILYGKIGDYKTAAMCEGKALEQMKNIWSEDNIYYIKVLSNFASIVRHLDLDGAENKSFEIEQKALVLMRKYLGEKHPTVITSLFNIAQYYVLNEKCDLAMPYYYDAVDLHSELYGKYNIDYFELMSEIWYVKLNNNIPFNDSDLENILFYCNNLIPTLKRQFGNMRTDIRNYYWANASSLLDLIYMICEDNGIDEKLSNVFAQSAFNYALVRKGLLVNSVRNISEILKRDSEEINTIKISLDSIYGTYRDLVNSKESDNTNQIQSIKNEIRLLENKLVEISNNHGDYANQMNMDYTSIINVLNDDEIAVEFVKYKGYHDVVKYAALMVTSEEASPIFVPLFDADTLEKINSNLYYSNLTISELIWHKLTKYIANKQTIFFSPDGELHNIAIEHVPYLHRSTFLNDSFQVYRLSSTRELLNRNHNSSIASATLFGDMDYNATIPASNDVNTAPDFVTSTRGLKDELLKRNGFNRLIATKVEVDSIQKVLSSHKTKTNLYTGIYGTEGAFKQLSDSKCSIIHIATHGVYWDSESFDSATLNFGNESDISSAPLTYVEDKAMTRSALLFSGANNTIKNGSDNVFDDGILTAHEISQMDLSDLDLAILSACKTGLGDISGDGVFGLQRGFKIAGAQSLLMSLWEVDDEATSKLMIEFYKNYLDGISKQESLKKAQKVVRETPGFEDPEYWAAFILLDALN